MVVGGDMEISLITEAGYMKPLSRLCLDDVSNLVSTLITYHLFIKVKAHMDQFREGVEHFGLDSYLSKCYSLLRPLFVDEKVGLTASTYMRHMRPLFLVYIMPNLPSTEQMKRMLVVACSEPGSRKRALEEQAYIFFATSIEECESKCGIILYNKVCMYQLTGDGCGCSLEDVLIFFSGADRVPPLGFPQSPSLSFLDVGAIFPTASTCSLQLRLPTQYTDYNEFINALKEALFCNGGLDGGP